VFSLTSHHHSPSSLRSPHFTGTAKPCKYTLVYDEVGFKVRELELLTYWR
jgi:hypothetical protein